MFLIFNSNAYNFFLIKSDKMANMPKFYSRCQLSFDISLKLAKSHQLGQKYHKVGLNKF